MLAVKSENARDRFKEWYLIERRSGNMLEQKDLEMIAEIVEKAVSPVKEDVSTLKGDMETVKGDVASLKGDMETVKGDVASLKGDVTSLKERSEKTEEAVKGLESGMKALQITLENETNKGIKIIAEGHLDLSRKLDAALEIENEKEMLKLRVNRLESEMEKVKAKLEETA